MAESEIKCRAGVHDACLDGRDDSEIYPEGSTWRADGTYSAGTIVCDACYVLVEPFANDNDRPLMHRAVDHYQVNLKYVREQEDEKLPELVEEAKSALARARVGSPAWVSADASARMVEDEVERRAKATST